LGLLIFCILKFSYEQIFKTCNPLSPIRLFMILPYWEPLKDNSVGLYTVRKTNWKYLLENTQIKEILCQVGQHYHSALCKKKYQEFTLSLTPFQKWHFKIKQIWILYFLTLFLFLSLFRPPCFSSSSSRPQSSTFWKF
jgi:hypothetical protein